MKKNNGSFVLIIILLLIILMMAVFIVVISQKNANAQSDQYCVPKGYGGVYYNLQDKVSVTVLNLENENDAQISAQLDNYFKSQKGGN